MNFEGRLAKACRRHLVALRSGGVLLSLPGILSSPAFAEELRDIRGPVAIPGDVIWLWFILIAAAAGLAAFLFFRKRGPVSAPAPVAERPPWEVALEELCALEKEEHVSAEQVKWFYSRLSQISRIYIERRFEIRAPEMTTEEFLEAAQASSALQENQKQSLRALLNASDLVKFAKTFPSASDLEGSLQLARLFIEETRIQSTVLAKQTTGPVAGGPGTEI